MHVFLPGGGFGGRPGASELESKESVHDQGDTRTAERGVAALEFEYRFDDLGRWALGSGFGPRVWRAQLAIFLAHERLMETIKKSIATSSFTCWSRNVRHVAEGNLSPRGLYFSTVDFATSMPSF